MKGFLQIFFYTVLSACLLALGIPNEFFHFGSPVIGLFSLAPLYLAFNACPNYKKAGTIGALHFSLVHILSSFWLANFKGFAIFTLGASAVAYFVAGYVFGLVLYLPFSNKKNKLTSSYQDKYYFPTRILYFACIWTIHEWYKSVGFLAYPWGTVLMSAYKWKLLTQIVSITGTFGLSFLFSLFSAVIGEGIIILKEYPKRTFSGYNWTVAFCMVIFGLSTVYGVFTYTKTRTPIKTFAAVLVQQNSDSWEEGGQDNSILKAQNLTEAAVMDFYQKTDTKPDIVLWNEAILTYALPDSYLYYNAYPREKPLVKNIRKLNIPHLIGGPILVNEEENLFSNSVILFEKNGDMGKWYGKIHLVPFAEAIPYADNPLVKKLMDAMVGFSSGWTPGKELTLFQLENKKGQNINFSTPICFEDAFADLCRLHFLNGSEVFVNLTNDSWSLTKSAEYQHFVIASYRAIECRTTLVRSTNSGFSVVVDPAGNILDSMPLFDSVSKTMTIPVYERIYTPYVITGDIIQYFAIFFALLVVFRFKIFQKNS